MLGEANSIVEEQTEYDNIDGFNETYAYKSICIDSDIKNEMCETIKELPTLR